MISCSLFLVFSLFKVKNAALQTREIKQQEQNSTNCYSKTALQKDRHLDIWHQGSAILYLTTVDLYISFMKGNSVNRDQVMHDSFKPHVTWLCIHKHNEWSRARLTVNLHIKRYNQLCYSTVKLIIRSSEDFLFQRKLMFK